jgi:hypothetical protein
VVDAVDAASNLLRSSAYSAATVVEDHVRALANVADVPFLSLEGWSEDADGFVHGSGLGLCFDRAADLRARGIRESLGDP